MSLSPKRLVGLLPLGTRLCEVCDHRMLAQAEMMVMMEMEMDSHGGLSVTQSGTADYEEKNIYPSLRSMDL